MQQRSGFLVLHRNIRTWTVVRTWDWYLLFGKIRPMLKCGKEGEEIDRLNNKIKEVEGQIVEEEKNRKAIEESHAKLLEEKNALFAQLESAKTSASEIEEKLNKVQSLQTDAA